MPANDPMAYAADDMSSIPGFVDSQGVGGTVAQLRGQRFRSNSAADQQRMAMAYLQRKGVPITMENRRAALAFLRGADVMQGSTEADIADAAMAAEGATAPQSRPSAAPNTSPRPQARPGDDNVTVPTGDPATAPVDENGNPILPAAAAAAAGAAAGYAAGRMHNGKPLTPNADGMVAVPRGDSGRGATSYALIPAQRAADEGWSVVGLNYDDGSRALPAPGAAAIDMIDGTAEDVTDVTGTAADNNTGRTQASGNTRNAGGARPSGTAASRPPAVAGPNAATSAPQAPAPVAGPAVSPDDAPISTEDIMGTSQRAPGVEEIPSPTSGANTARIIDTGQRGPTGELVYRDGINGGYVARDADGVWVRAQTVDQLHAALRAALRAAR